MSLLKFKKSKRVLIYLLFISMLMMNCAICINMKPTGKYATVSREKIGEVISSREFKYPTPENPYLIVEFGKYIEYEEQRKVQEIGAKKDFSFLIVSTSLAALGFYLVNKGNKMKGESYKEAWTTVGGGLLAAFFSFGVLSESYDLITKQKNCSRSVSKEIKIVDKNNFNPLTNIRIRAFSQSCGKEWLSVTDKNGRVSLNIAEIAPFITEGTDLNISFQALDYNNYTHNKKINADFFSDLKAYYVSIRPPDLKTKLDFDDSESWANNKIVDGLEKAYLTAIIENQGEGKALDVKLSINCNNPSIMIDKLISLGTILPRNKAEQRIPITALMELSDGSAIFDVRTIEQRGYNAQTVQLEVPTRKLKKPALQIVSVDINDGHIGLAKGNGNGIPENGETVELIAYVKNQGIGPAIGSKLNLGSISSGINTILGEVDLSRIEASATEKSKVIIEIPRKFSKSILEYRLIVTDVRNACPPAEKSGYYQVGQVMPILAYEFKSPSNLTNSSSGSIIVIPKNIGKLTANGVRLSVTTIEKGIILSNNTILLGYLAPSIDYNPQIISVQVPRTFTKNSLNVEIKLTQDEFTELIENREIPITIIQPELRLLDRSNLDQQIVQGTIGAQLIIAVANEGNLIAEDVKVTASTNIEMIKFNNAMVSFDNIPPKSISQNKTFVLEVPGAVASGSLPIHLKVSQKDFPSLEKIITYKILERGTEHFAVQPTEDFQTRSSEKSSAQPPVIQIPYVKNNDQIFSNNLSFTAFVADNYGLASVKATLNDVIFYNSQTDEGAKADDKALIIKKELTTFRPGQNIIKIVAVNNSNIPQQKIITVNYIASMHIRKGDWYTRVPERVANWISSSKNVAIVIGIDNYINPKIRDLQYADNDAIAIRDFLKQHTNFEIYAELINEKATKDNILGVLDNLKRDNSITRVVFYFSGHGRTEKSGTGSEDLGYFQPVDFDPQRPLTTGIPMSQVRDWAQALPAKHVLFIFDACFSGIVGGSARTDKDYNLDFLAENVGRHVITAGTKDDEALEYNSVGHGALTYYLLKGLQGEADVDNDNVITLNELAVYLKRHVTNFTKGKQHPQLIKFFDGDGELFIELIK